jgi:hypothetical protein
MQLGIANGIRGFAGIALGTKNLSQAVRLFGAAEALIKITGAIVADADEKAINERNLTALRDQLDENSFVAGWQEGMQMDIEEAIAYALEVLPGIQSP